MPQGMLQFTREWGVRRGLTYSYYIVQYQLFVKAATCNFLRMPLSGWWWGLAITLLLGPLRSEQCLKQACYEVTMSSAGQPKFSI